MKNKKAAGFCYKKYNCTLKDNFFCRACLTPMRPSDSDESDQYDTLQDVICKSIFAERDEKQRCQDCDYIFHKSCFNGFKIENPQKGRKMHCYLCKETAKKKNNAVCIVCNNSKDLLLPVKQNKLTYHAHIVCMFFSPDFVMARINPVEFIPIRDLEERRDPAASELAHCSVCSLGILAEDSHFVCQHQSNEPCSKKAHIFCVFNEFVTGKEAEKRAPQGTVYITSLPMLEDFDSEIRQIKNLKEEVIVDLIKDSPLFSTLTNNKQKENAVDYLKKKIMETGFTVKQLKLKMLCLSHSNRNNMYCNNNCDFPDFVNCSGCNGWFHTVDECQIFQELDSTLLKEEYKEKIRRYPELKKDDMHTLAKDAVHKFSYYCKNCINYAYTFAYEDDYVADYLNFKTPRDIMDFAVRCRISLQMKKDDPYIAAFAKKIYIKEEGFILTNGLLKNLNDFLHQDVSEEFDSKLFKFLESITEPKTDPLMKFLEHLKNEVGSCVRDRDNKSKNANRKVFLEKLYIELLNFFHNFSEKNVKSLSLFLSKVLVTPKFSFVHDSVILLADILRNFYITPLQNIYLELEDVIEHKNAEILRTIISIVSQDAVTVETLVGSLRCKLTNYDIRMIVDGKEFPNATYEFILKAIEHRYQSHLMIDVNFASLSFDQIESTFDNLIHAALFHQDNEAEIRSFMGNYLELVEERKKFTEVHDRLKLLRSISPKDFLVEKENMQYIILKGEITDLKMMKFSKIVYPLFDVDFNACENDDLIIPLETKIVDMEENKSENPDKVKCFLKEIARTITSNGLAVTPRIQKFLESNMGAYRLKHFLKGRLGLFTIEQMEELKNSVTEACDGYFRVLKITASIDACVKIVNAIETEFTAGMNYSRLCHERFNALYEEAAKKYLYHPKLEVLKQNFDFLSDLVSIKSKELCIDLEKSEALDAAEAAKQLDSIDDLQTLEALKALRLDKPMLKEVEYLHNRLNEKYEEALVHHFSYKKPKIYGHLLSKESETILKSRCEVRYSQMYDAHELLLRKIRNHYEEVSKTTDFYEKAEYFNRAVDDILKGYEAFEIDSGVLMAQLEFLFKIKFKLSLLCLMKELIELPKNPDAFKVYVNHKQTYKCIIDFLNDLRGRNTKIRFTKVIARFKETFDYIVEVDSQINSLKRKLERMTLNEEETEEKLSLEDANKILELIGEHAYINQDLVSQTKLEISLLNATFEETRKFLEQIMFQRVTELKLKKKAIRDQVDEISKLKIVHLHIQEINRQYIFLLKLVESEHCSFKEFLDMRSDINISLQIICQDERYSLPLFQDLKQLEDNMSVVKNYVSILSKSCETLVSFRQILDKINQFLHETPYHVYFFHESYPQMVEELSIIGEMIRFKFDRYFSLFYDRKFKLVLPFEITSKIEEKTTQIKTINDYFGNQLKAGQNKEENMLELLYECARSVLDGVVECFDPIIRTNYKDIAIKRETFLKSTSDLHIQLRKYLSILEVLINQGSSSEGKNTASISDLEIGVNYNNDYIGAFIQESNAHKFNIWLLKVVNFIINTKNNKIISVDYLCDTNYKYINDIFLKRYNHEKCKNKKKIGFFCEYFKILFSFISAVLPSPIASEIINKLAPTYKPAIIPNTTKNPASFFNTTGEIKHISELEELGMKNIIGSTLFVSKTMNEETQSAVSLKIGNLKGSLFGTKTETQNPKENKFVSLVRNHLETNSYFSDTPEIKEAMSKLSTIIDQKVKTFANEDDKRKFIKVIKKVLNNLRNLSHMCEELEESGFSYEWLEHNMIKSLVNKSSTMNQTDGEEKREYEQSSFRFENPSCGKDSMTDKGQALDTSCKKEHKVNTIRSPEVVSLKKQNELKEDFIKDIKKVKIPGIVIEDFAHLVSAKAFKILCTSVHYKTNLDVSFWTRMYPSIFKKLKKMEIYLKLLISKPVLDIESDLIHKMNTEDPVKGLINVIPGWIEISKSDANKALIIELESLPTKKAFYDIFCADGAQSEIIIGRYLDFSKKLRKRIDFIDHCMKEKISFKDLYAFFIVTTCKQNSSEMELEQTDVINYEVCNKFVNQNSIGKEYTSFSELSQSFDRLFEDPNEIFSPHN